VRAKTHRRGPCGRRADGRAETKATARQLAGQSSAVSTPSARPS